MGSGIHLLREKCRIGWNPGQGIAVTSNGATPTLGANNTEFPEVSIMSTGGALLTIWARPVRNWLWGILLLIQ